MRQPQNLVGAVIAADDAAIRRARNPDQSRDGLHDRRQLGRARPFVRLVAAQLLFRLAPRIFGSHALDAESELPRDGKRHADLGFRKPVWPVVIGHEFAYQPAFRDEREEAERANTFADYALLQLSRDFRFVDILDEDRLGVVRSRNPRGVSVDSALIML